MNYARIYAEFISDRLTKQPSKPDYFEKHHILPRSLGGGNEKLNIIRLTPEDPYFAHLLLAQVHGGHLWSCVMLLSKKSRHGTSWIDVVGPHRYGYGLARRKHAEKERLKDGLKGSDNGNHNPAKFKWKNLDTGKKEYSTLHDMWKKHGASRGQWTMVASGARGSILGWSIEGSVVKRHNKGKSFNFINRDGRTYAGTQRDFCVSKDINIASASRVVRHGDVTKCGWRLVGSPDRVAGNTRDGRTSGQQGSGKIFTFTDKLGNLVFSGRRIEAAKYFECGVQDISAGACSVRKGITKTFKGCFVTEKIWQQKTNCQLALFAT